MEAGERREKEEEKKERERIEGGTESLSWFNDLYRVRNLILVKNSTTLALTMCSESCNSLFNNKQHRGGEVGRWGTRRRRGRGSTEATWLESCIDQPNNTGCTSSTESKHERDVWSILHFWLWIAAMCFDIVKYTYVFMTEWYDYFNLQSVWGLSKGVWRLVFLVQRMKDRIYYFFLFIFTNNNTLAYWLWFHLGTQVQCLF